VDTTEREDKGWKEAQRQGDFMDNSITSVEVFVHNWAEIGPVLCRL
jgi:uncharacterized protein (DUF952 family)